MVTAVAVVTLVSPLFLCFALVFLVTIATLRPHVAPPRGELVLCHVVTMVTSVVFEVGPIRFCLLLVTVKALFWLPGVLLAEVSVVGLAVHGGALQQLFHFAG